MQGGACFVEKRKKNIEPEVEQRDQNEQFKVVVSRLKAIYLLFYNPVRHELGIYRVGIFFLFIH